MVVLVSQSQNVPEFVQHIDLRRINEPEVNCRLIQRNCHAVGTDIRPVTLHLPERHPHFRVFVIRKFECDIGANASKR